MAKATSPAPVTSGPRNRPYGKAAVVDAVLAAAEQEFVAKGPARATTRDVAARAGVSHALIFRHFGTKDELVRAVYLRHISRTWEGLNEPGVSLAFVRIYRLSQPLVFPDSQKYGGCRSWVELPELPAGTSLEPVLDDATHNTRAAELRAVI